ncbi:hypothetical protein [Brevibacillus sp. NRS-1366]|uniref:hypothetical protein n=1 Tax=Brevibacillus sp. NRS-1366 TaxID=3233899 RepID=UPI003D1A4201
MQYKGIELSCTQEELDAFVAGIQLYTEIRDFSQKFNGVTIENPTENPNAKYYILKVQETLFLQTHSPFDPGFVAITDTNAEAVIEAHKQSIIDNMVMATFMKEPEDTTNEKIRDLMLVATDLYEQNLALEERIAALEGAGA